MGRFHAHRPYKLAEKKSMGFNLGEPGVIFLPPNSTFLLFFFRGLLHPLVVIQNFCSADEGPHRKE